MISKYDLAQTFDHTLLKPNSTSNQVRKLCNEANEYHFKAVCLPPSYLEFATKHLSSSVKRCTVIGFPTGYQTRETKLFECNDVLSLGAQEVDTVISIGNLKEARFDQIIMELTQLANLCHEKQAILKVIFETSELTDKEIIQACKLCTEAKVDFVKTSTGFSSAGAQLQHIDLMKNNISNKMKIKASGGIRTLKQATTFLNAGAHRLGLSAGVKIMNEYALLES